MVLKGNRRSSNPIIISKNNETTFLQRIPFSEKQFKESWLQELIQNNSSLLPIGEIEPSFAESFSIGREIKTNAGFIDNLLINEDGYITIIETKLWRNIQSRREVVGQIIDYAKELTKWTFDNLNEAVLQVNKNKSIFEIAKQNAHVSEIDETYFIDSVSKNLNRGRFLLLIVGDGIQESVEEMVDYLQQFAQINFTLALIELQVFKNTNDDSLIVLPQIITRTREITRAIIKIENNFSKEINIDVQTNLEEIKQDKIQLKSTISYDEFFEQLRHNTNQIIVEFVSQVVNDCEKRGMLIELGQSTLGFKLLDNENNKISIFFIDKKNFFYLWYIARQMNRRGYNPELGNMFIHKISELFEIKLNYTSDFKFKWVKYLKITDLQSKYDSFIKHLDEFIIDFNKEMDTKNT